MDDQEPLDDKLPDNNMIEVRGLTKVYDGFTAVDGISFEVRKGEIFAFLGPNGAGKTTTIKMLTTLLTPTSGKILLDGHDPVTDQEAARRSFGIVFFTTHIMEEAERVANTVAVIDHGKIIAQASPQELQKQTNTQSLEDAYLALTGKTIREEEAPSAIERMRMRRRVWSGRR